MAAITHQERLAGTSDQAMEKATGRSWSGWIELLDQRKADQVPHKELVKLLSNYLHHPWWCQKVATGYREYKSERKVGQTADRKFQVGVQKTIAVDAHTLWDLLVSEEGMEIWLGRRENPLSDPPHLFHTGEGVEGQIRVLNPGSHIRMTWKLREWDQASVLQIRVVRKDQRSVLSFHQEALPTAAMRDHMKTHWSSKMDQLINLLDDPSGK